MGKPVWFCNESEQRRYWAIVEHAVGGSFESLDDLIDEVMGKY